MMAMEMKKMMKMKVKVEKGDDKEEDDTIRSLKSNRLEGSQHKSQFLERCETSKKFVKGATQRQLQFDPMVVGPSTIILNPYPI
jgi:hypothetical protein